MKNTSLRRETVSLRVHSSMVNAELPPPKKSAVNGDLGAVKRVEGGLRGKKLYRPRPSNRFSVPSGAIPMKWVMPTYKAQ